MHENEFQMYVVYGGYASDYSAIDIDSMMMISIF